MRSTTQEVLGAKSLRATPQRIAIYEALRARKDHPTVETIHAQVSVQHPTISLNTVYATLSTLEEAGLIRGIDAGDGLSRYDGNPAPHAHLVCTRCGRVDDLELEIDPKALGLVRRAEAVSGYTVSDHAVYFYGRCPDCQKSGQEREDE